MNEEAKNQRIISEIQMASRRPATSKSAKTDLAEVGYNMSTYVAGLDHDAM
jgi:hypothetical protein